MISAIAARKATMGSPPTGQITNYKASQKAEKKVKKARKSKPFESSNGWNGIVATGHDLLKEQQDVVMDSTSRREVKMSMSEVDHNDAWTESVRPPSAKPPNSATDDSSEDGNNDTREGIQLENLLPQFPSLVRSNDRVTILSTFKPAPGQNFFTVSGGECSSLGVNDPGTIVCLTAEDTLCLLGNFQLTVLQGSLELFGIILPASKTAHRVYAPRCSPLPIIKSGRGQNSASVPDARAVPYRLRGIFGFNTVVMFHSLETGVEGLGRICRPFDGMFEPSRISTSSAMGVPGLYMVCYLALFVFFLNSPDRYGTQQRNYIPSSSLRHGQVPLMLPSSSNAAKFRILIYLGCT
jgi:polynucleotide 5'-hydroxyl-kinase GRC3/NOL9